MALSSKDELTTLSLHQACTCLKEGRKGPGLSVWRATTERVTWLVIHAEERYSASRKFYRSIGMKWHRWLCQATVEIAGLQNKTKTFHVIKWSAIYSASIIFISWSQLLPLFTLSLHSADKLDGVTWLGLGVKYLLNSVKKLNYAPHLLQMQFDCGSKTVICYTL